jgi:hypothetical protein
MKYKYTKEQLQDVVIKSTSYVGVLRLLGINNTGGNNSYIKKRILSENINTSHFLGKKSNLNKSSCNKLNYEQILIINRIDRREEAKKLRRALIESGREHKCELCNNDGVWNKFKLVLEIDHINRNWQDNRAENLRFLCPNCHSQVTNNTCGCGGTADAVGLEPTKGNLNGDSTSLTRTKKIKKKNCKCGILICDTAISCKKCRPKKEKIVWPNDEELKILVWSKPLNKLAKELGVSDKAIAKRCKKRNIEYPKHGYWQKEYIKNMPT